MAAIISASLAVEPLGADGGALGYAHSANDAVDNNAAAAAATKTLAFIINP